MIELERVLLRPLERTDLPSLYEFRNDAEVVRQLGGFSVGYSSADLADWFERHQNRNDEVLWAIAERSENRCIGHVGLYQIDARVRKAEFAVVVGNRAFQGQGVGKAVSIAVVDYGFKELNLHRISLQVLETNARAIHLYEGMGFRREGVLRHDQFRAGEYVNVLCMSVLDGEWGR